MTEALEQPRLKRIVSRDGHEIILGLQRGMIFWGHVLPSEARGGEQKHDVSAPCPWLIVSRNSIHGPLPIAIAVPLSTRLDKGGVHRILLGPEGIVPYHRAGSAPLYRGPSLALTEQLRVMAHERFIDDPIAEVTKTAMATVEAGIRYVVGVL